MGNKKECLVYSRNAGSQAHQRIEGCLYTFIQYFEMCMQSALACLREAG